MESANTTVICIFVQMHKFYLKQCIYDNADNILSITYLDNKTLSYQYDSLERVSSVVGYANFTYTVDNKISTIKYANGVLTTYSYNSRDEPTRILTTYGGTTLMDLNYTYDGDGNVLSIDNETYSYNLLDQLISSIGSWGVYNYTYDPDGNLVSLTQNGNTTSFTYGSNNQLLTMGSINFTYDNDGNMLTEVNGSQSWGYSYNYANQLVNVTLNSQLVQTNLYESNGNRIMVTDNGSSVVYAYEGNTIIYEKNMTSGLVTDRFYANGLQVAETLNGTVQYLHEDALGSIRLVTTSSASSTFSSDYEPFGLSANTSGISEFQYTDKSVDSITGLYYFGARFYDPSIYRFISTDSETGSLQDPLSQNGYIYAEDNPEVYIDPDGHMFAHPLYMGGESPPQTEGTNALVSAVASAVTTGLGIWNDWNNMPTLDKVAIVETVAGSALAIGLTAGFATPAVVPIDATVFTADTSATYVAAENLLENGGSEVTTAEAPNLAAEDQVIFTSTNEQPNQNFINENFLGGKYSIGIADGSENVYRNFGGDSFDIGQWFTPTDYQEAQTAKTCLSLPNSNTAELSLQGRLLPGTVYLSGEAFGGGQQYYILKGGIEVTNIWCRTG